MLFLSTCSKNEKRNDLDMKKTKFLNTRMHKLLKYFFAFLIAIIVVFGVSKLLFGLMQKYIITWDYNIALAISNDNQEKWLLVFFPLIAEEMKKPLKINLPPLKHLIVEEDCYRQYVIIRGAMKREVVELRFHTSMPYTKFFLLALGWKIDPAVEYLNINDLASCFETNPHYSHFLFNPNYTGIDELDNYEPFATIILE